MKQNPKTMELGRGMCSKHGPYQLTPKGCPFCERDAMWTRQDNCTHVSFQRKLANTIIEECTECGFPRLIEGFDPFNSGESYTLNT